MKIGILSAFGVESRPLRMRLTEIDREMRGDFLFFFHQSGEDDIISIRTGHGLDRASEGTQLLIDGFRPDCIINCGVAGAISPQRRPGDVVISESVLHYHGEQEWTTVARFHPDMELIQAALEGSSGLSDEFKVVAGPVLSGESVIDRLRTKTALWEQFRGECVEQEGAGVARVCSSNHIPWLVIRGISDLADEALHRDFRRNISQAADHASSVLFELMRQLPRYINIHRPSSSVSK